MRDPGPAVLQRRAIRVSGLVQGVGFRPYVHAVASRLGVAGFVGNDERGVVIEAEGSGATLDALLAEIRDHPPPLALVTAISAAQVPVRGDQRFTIEASTARGPGNTLVSADAATCADCVRELRDPAHPGPTATHPERIQLAVDAREPVLGCGAELKNTSCYHAAARPSWSACGPVCERAGLRCWCTPGCPSTTVGSASARWRWPPRSRRSSSDRGERHTAVVAETVVCRSDRSARAGPSERHTIAVAATVVRRS